MNEIDDNFEFEKIDIVAIMTCYNRVKKTTNCIKSLMKNKSNIKFVVVDDNSSDGTDDALLQLNSDIDIIKGTGNLFWNRGMYKGIQYVKENYHNAKYYLLFNDDVLFKEHCIDDMVKNIRENEVLVGSTCDDTGSLSYGGIKYKGGKSLRYRTVGPDEPEMLCDTFNMNCLVIPKEIFMKIDNLDNHYRHAMGDFDYGLQIKREGYQIKVWKEYVGVCNCNLREKSWNDTSLSITERIRKKEGIKGLPFKEWFYFLKKNFGLDVAIIRSITPYIRILLRR